MQNTFVSRFLLVVVLILGFATLVVAQGTVPPADAKPADAKAADAKPADAAKTADPAKPADAKPADAGKAADFKDELLMEKCGEAGKVVFNHAAHAEANSCAACHEGTPPVFEKKRSTEGMKMADMYAGKMCGHCHNGTKVFAAKTSCAKCHQKE